MSMLTDSMVFRAPREGDGSMHQSTDAKKLHGKGTDMYGDGRTLQLLDPGPVGRFGEKLSYLLSYLLNG